MMVWDHFTFDWYLGIFGLAAKPDAGTTMAASGYVQSTGLMLNALCNSLMVATVTTNITTVIGTATALARAHPLPDGGLLQRLPDAADDDARYRSGHRVGTVDDDHHHRAGPHGWP
jgi:hypothetical protein